MNLCINAMIHHKIQSRFSSHSQLRQLRYGGPWSGGCQQLTLWQDHAEVAEVHCQPLREMLVKVQSESGGLHLEA